MKRWGGLHRAVVDDARDPQGRGRLQVSVSGTPAQAVWAEACLPPLAGGVLAMPQVGSLVWVQFERGDVNAPVWTGVTWEAADQAPSQISTEGVLTVRAPSVGVEAAQVRVTGTLQCETLIATSVIASSYTPGVGNTS